MRLRILADATRMPLQPSDRRLLSYIVIDAALLWAEYSKAYFFSTALAARDTGGGRITHQQSFADRNEALAFAIAIARADVQKTANFTHRDHPDWQAPGVIRKVLTAMNASTLPRWQLGMGVKTNVLADLPTMRNFFAHKGESAAEKARNLRSHYGITQQLSPWDLLCTTPPNDRQPIIWTWLDDLAVTIRMTA